MSPTTSMCSPNMEHLKEGLPVSFQEHLGALTGTVLTGTWRGNVAVANTGAGLLTKLLSAISGNMLAIFWQTFRLMLLSPSQLMDKTSKTT